MTWDRRTAVHEAGHHVVAEALGVRVAQVAVHASGGRTEFADGWPPPAQTLPIVLAGWEAELLAFGDVHDVFCRDDMARADLAAFELCGGTLDEVDDLIARWRLRTSAILAGRWAEVERVTQVLAARGVYTPGLIAGRAA